VASNSVMTPTKLNWATHATVAAAVFAVPYKFWLTTPVLQNISIGYWRLLAILVAVAVGAALSLMGVATPALSCGAIVGLLTGGSVTAWTAPTDVAISPYRAFASHLESCWREVLILVVAATLATRCSSFLRKHRPLVQ
jgi:hypothetical protein